MSPLVYVSAVCYVMGSWRCSRWSLTMHTYKKASTDEVLTPRDIVILETDAVVNVKFVRSHICHGLSPVDMNVVLYHCCARLSRGILHQPVYDQINRTLV